MTLSFETKANSIAHTKCTDILNDHGLAYVDFVKPNARKHALKFSKWVAKKGYVYEVSKCDGVYEVFWRVVVVAPDVTIVEY